MVWAGANGNTAKGPRPEKRWPRRHCV